jgi:hypothetical protein
MSVTSKAKEPSLPMMVVFSWAGVEESLIFASPAIGAPVAATPLTTWEETPSPPRGIIIPSPSTGENEGERGNSGLFYEEIIDWWDDL